MPTVALFIALALPPLSGVGGHAVDVPDVLLIDVRTPRDVAVVEGQFLVRPDGTVSLGDHGSLRVAGLTIPQVFQAVQKHITSRLGGEEPFQVKVALSANNSRFVYLFADGAGYGEQVYRLPISGGETVLDLVAQAGVAAGMSAAHVWVSRRTPGVKMDQILPVDWKAITSEGKPETNYRLIPGDRLYVRFPPAKK